MEIWIWFFLSFLAVFLIFHLISGSFASNAEGYERIFKRILDLDEQDTSYKTFSIPKKDGTTRTIDAPNNYLKDVQSLVLYELQKNIILPGYITGFRKKMSIKSNAKKHIGKKIVINLDIKDFFSNVTVEKMTSRLTYLNIPKESIDRIEKLCFYNGRLPQGAPTSPFLANFIFLPVDQAITNLLTRYDSDVSYSRYADNITISSDISQIVNAIRIIEQSILPNAGFELNKAKTNISRAHSRQTVTGIVVNEKLSYPKKKYKLLRAKVHTFLAKGTGDAREIAGHLAFLRMLDKKKYLSLKDYYKKKFPIAAKFSVIFPEKRIREEQKNIKEVPPTPSYLNDVGVTSIDFNNNSSDFDDKNI